MKPFDFKVAPFFPSNFSIAGWIFVGIGVLAILVNFWVAIGMLLAGIVFATTQYRMTIDPVAKTIKDYVWFLGFKNGETVGYDNIEYLFLKKSRQSQTMNGRVSSSTIHTEVYDGYLRISEQQKFHLGTSMTHDTMLAKLHGLAKQLNVKVYDYTSGQPIEFTAA